MEWKKMLRHLQLSTNLPDFIILDLLDFGPFVPPAFSENSRTSHEFFRYGYKIHTVAGTDLVKMAPWPRAYSFHLWGLPVDQDAVDGYEIL